VIGRNYFWIAPDGLAVLYAINKHVVKQARPPGPPALSYPSPSDVRRARAAAPRARRGRPAARRPRAGAAQSAAAAGRRARRRSMPAGVQALGWARTRPAWAGGHVGVAMCTCDLCKGPFVRLVQAGADVNAQARALAGSAAVGSGSLGTCMVGTGASPAPAPPALPAAAASPGVPGSRGCRQPARAFARGRGRCARAAVDGRAAARRSRRACTGTTPWAWRASSGATRRWLRILRRWRWRPRSWTPPPAAWPTSTPRRAVRPRPAGGQQGASRGPCAAPRAPHEAARSLGIGRATRCGGELLRGARPAGARAPSLDPCAPTVEPRIVLHSQARALHSQAGACAGAGVPARQAGQLIYVPVVLP